MRNLVVIVLSLTILSVTYIATFGAPAAVSALFVSESATEGADVSEARPERPSQGGGGATAVVLSSLEAESYALTLRTIGTATSLRSVDVVATVSGQITDINLPLNGYVEVGDVLIQLDNVSEVLALEIAVAEADLARATLERYETLAEAGNLTITAADLAEVEVAARLEETNVALAEQAIEDRVIRAPISGSLGLSDVSVGDYLNVNDPVVGIEDTSVIIAEFEVPERSIDLLETGKEVLVGTPTYRGHVFRGEIIAFDTRLDDVTRSATVRAEIDNSDGSLWSGMSFGVRMIEETDPLPVVPSTAVTWEQDGAGIWVVADDIATRVPVTIRYREGDLVWVDVDLPEGAQIVAEGAIKLREGATVADAGSPA